MNARAEFSDRYSRWLAFHTEDMLADVELVTDVLPSETRAMELLCAALEAGEDESAMGQRRTLERFMAFRRELQEQLAGVAKSRADTSANRGEG